jgi:hypothetical protein
MSDNILDLSVKRTPVTYSVHVTHHWDGKVEVEVEGISDDPRSRKCASDALLTAAELLEGRGQTV